MEEITSKRLFNELADLLYDLEDEQGIKIDEKYTSKFEDKGSEKDRFSETDRFIKAMPRL